MPRSTRRQPRRRAARRLRRRNCRLRRRRRRPVVLDRMTTRWVACHATPSRRTRTCCGAEDDDAGTRHASLDALYPARRCAASLAPKLLSYRALEPGVREVALPSAARTPTPSPTTPTRSSTARRPAPARPRRCAARAGGAAFAAPARTARRHRWASSAEGRRAAARVQGADREGAAVQRRRLGGWCVRRRPRRGAPWPQPAERAVDVHVSRLAATRSGYALACTTPPHYPRRASPGPRRILYTTHPTTLSRATHRASPLKISLTVARCS